MQEKACVLNNRVQLAPTLASTASTKGGGGSGTLQCRRRRRRVPGPTNPVKAAACCGNPGSASCHELMRSQGQRQAANSAQGPEPAVTVLSSALGSRIAGCSVVVPSLPLLAALTSAQRQHAALDSRGKHGGPLDCVLTEGPMGLQCCARTVRRELAG